MNNIIFDDIENSDVEQSDDEIDDLSEFTQLLGQIWFSV